MLSQAVDPFSVHAHAKWILTGEHAVVRGHPALVFPKLDQKMTLHYTPTTHPLCVTTTPRHYTARTAALFAALITKSTPQIPDLSSLCGDIMIENSLPIGMGMGASAALCVIFTKWLSRMGYLPSTYPVLFQFAHALENDFHGKSSGVDIAGAWHTYGIRFMHHTPITRIMPTWQPALYLSFVKGNSHTAKAVQQVETLFTQRPHMAKKMDLHMSLSTEIATRALTTVIHSPQNRATAQQALTHAIQSAHNCFQAWGLISDTLATHIAQLLHHGALAAKPTGAGGTSGGILSIWPSSLRHKATALGLIPAPVMMPHHEATENNPVDKV